MMESRASIRSMNPSLDNGHRVDIPLSPRDDLASLLKAAGDSRRLEVLRALRANAFGALELADIFAMRQNTMSHHLKLLTRAGLVSSTRGAEGGYCLGRAPETISAAEVLDVLDGPLAITECSTENSQCELEPLCQVSDAWQKINRAIRAALDDISLADLAGPARKLSVSGLTQGITRTISRQQQ